MDVQVRLLEHQPSACGLLRTHALLRLHVRACLASYLSYQLLSLGRRRCGHFLHPLLLHASVHYLSHWFCLLSLLPFYGTIVLNA